MPRIDLPSMTRPSRPAVTRERKRLAVCTKRAAARACSPSRLRMASSRRITPAFFARISLAT